MVQLANTIYRRRSPAEPSAQDAGDIVLTDFVPAVLNPVKRPRQERFMLFTVSASTR